MNEFCKWEVNDDGVWLTYCNNAHEFINGDPDENGFNYCPYCGKEIEMQ